MRNWTKIGLMTATLLLVIGAPTASAAWRLGDCGDSVGPLHNVPATGDCWGHLNDPDHPCDVVLFLGKSCYEV